MKKPRALTPEEEALWHESNRLTTKKKPSVNAATEPAPVPPPVGERLGGGRQVPKPQPQTPTPKFPTLKKPAEKPSLKTLTLREAKRAFKPHGKPEATLDLHGLTKLDAYAKVQQFIARQQRNDKRHVAIITGKGRAGEAGVLRTNLPHWLNEPGLRLLISAFAHAPAEKGGSGVTHVLLKKKVNGEE